MAHSEAEAHPGRRLWAELAAVEPYPSGVLRIPEQIQGTAFFPGGMGVWIDPHASGLPVPVERIIVLGQDFDTEKAYRRALARGSEVSTSRTWINLRKILDGAGVPLDQFFFTNVYMGMRGGAKPTGRFPGAVDPEYRKRCVSFLVRQMGVLRPKLILTLGLAPLRVLGSILDGVDRPTCLSAVERVYYPVQTHHGLAAIVPLTHPSYYHVNVRRRRYGKLTGASAEQAMIAQRTAGCLRQCFSQSSQHSKSPRGAHFKIVC